MCHEIGGEINFLKNFEVVLVNSRVAYYLLEKKHYQINDTMHNLQELLYLPILF